MKHTGLNHLIFPRVFSRPHLTKTYPCPRAPAASQPLEFAHVYVFPSAALAREVARAVSGQLVPVPVASDATATVTVAAGGGGADVGTVTFRIWCVFVWWRV